MISHEGVVSLGYSPDRVFGAAILTKLMPKEILYARLEPQGDVLGKNELIAVNLAIPGLSKILRRETQGNLIVSEYNENERIALAFDAKGIGHGSLEFEFRDKSSKYQPKTDIFYRGKGGIDLPWPINTGGEKIIKPLVRPISDDLTRQYIPNIAGLLKQQNHAA